MWATCFKNTSDAATLGLTRSDSLMKSWKHFCARPPTPNGGIQRTWVDEMRVQSSTGVPLHPDAPDVPTDEFPRQRPGEQRLV